MATIVTRAGKGSALTFTEGDNNFINLNTDKVETSFGSLSDPRQGITINPTKYLEPDTTYYVVMDATAVKNLFTGANIGETDVNRFRFKTKP